MPFGPPQQRKREEESLLERHLQIGLGGFALVVAALAVSGNVLRLGAEKNQVDRQAASYLSLAKVSTADRRDVDYARLDDRLRRMAAQPAMVGLAVGVVENGRITFLNGYGETVAGSGAGDTRSSGSGGSGSVLAVGVRSSSRKDLLRKDCSIVGSFRATWLAKAPMNTHEA